MAVRGDISNGQCDIPMLDEGLTYTQVAAGVLHSLLLRSDGTVVACGSNSKGQCNIPALDEGITYTQVAAGTLLSVRCCTSAPCQHQRQRSVA